MALGRRPLLGHPQVISGIAEARGSGLIDRLFEAMKKAGVRVGARWSIVDRVGEENLPVQHVGPATFLRLELEESMRAHPAAVIAALQLVLP